MTNPTHPWAGAPGAATAGPGSTLMPRTPAGSGPAGLRSVLRAASNLMHSDAAGGVLLAVCAACALVIANSPLQGAYQAVLDVPVAVRVGEAGLDKPLLLWVNDGLMAIFFLLVGLELKRAVLEGELSTLRKAALPAFAALGGMLVPALLFAGLNRDDPVALRGWAIPAATDIAFALGVLALLGSRVPAALKVFLLGVAVIDDLGAIVIIAMFYTDSLAANALLAALAIVAMLALLNRLGVASRTPYLLLGLALWLSVLQSGVHATLAGVVLAAFLPLRLPDGERSPALALEHDLKPWVVAGILPVFAFANAGVSFAGVTPAALLEPLPLGIAAGLVLGKVAGVFGFALIAVRARLAQPVPGVGTLDMLGVSALCGIGFTMSLFIGSLAFEHGGPEYGAMVRLGILSGSLVAGAAGYVLLRLAVVHRHAWGTAVAAAAR